MKIKLLSSKNEPIFGIDVFILSKVLQIAVRDLMIHSLRYAQLTKIKNFWVRYPTQLWTTRREFHYNIDFTNFTFRGNTFICTTLFMLLFKYLKKKKLLFKKTIAPK